MKSIHLLLFLLLSIYVSGQNTFSLGAGVAIHEYDEIGNVTYTSSCDGCVSHISSYTVIKQEIYPITYTVGYQHNIELNKVFSVKTGADLYYHEASYTRISLGSDPGELYPYTAKYYSGFKDLDLAVPLYLSATYKRFSLSVGASVGFLMYTKKLNSVNGYSNYYYKTEFFPKYITPRLWLDLDLSYRFYKQFSLGIRLKKSVEKHDPMGTVSLLYTLKNKSLEKDVPKE